MGQYYLTQRDRDIQRSINARVRAMPPLETWRTPRRTFGAGTGLQTTAGEAEDNIPTGQSGTVRLYKGPLSSPTLLEDPAGGGGAGGFDTGFNDGFQTGSLDWVTVEAYNLTESPIWSGSRVIVSRITLKGGEADSSGWVIVEHNAASVLRGKSPASQTPAGSTVTFTEIMPIDGYYYPVGTESIYCPTELSASQVVTAHFNYNAVRWEADPVGAGSTPQPGGDIVRVVRVHQQGAADGDHISPISYSSQVWGAVLSSHDGTNWIDANPLQSVWLIGTNKEERWISLQQNERYVGWYIGERIYNSQSRPAYATLLVPTSLDQYYGTNNVDSESFYIDNDVKTNLVITQTNPEPLFAGMRAADDWGDARNLQNTCIHVVDAYTLQITKDAEYSFIANISAYMYNNNQNGLASCVLYFEYSNDGASWAELFPASEFTMATSTSNYVSVIGATISSVTNSGMRFVPSGLFIRLAIQCTYIYGSPPNPAFSLANGSLIIQRLKDTADYT